MEPALTPEEWAADDYGAVVRDGQWIYAPKGVFGIVVGQGKSGHCVGGDSLPALIAIANAALPDGDPYKITRDDVDLLQRVVINVDADELPGYGLPIERLATKLAAFLPAPDGNRAF